MIFDEVVNNIQAGIEGKNVGLDNGFDRINRYLFGVQKHTYYLLFGPTGSGKTALADAMFVYNPFLSGGKMKVIYYSLEISAQNKITKFICRRLWEQYKIKVDVNYVLSRGKNRISDEVYKKVLSTKDFFEPMEDMILIRDSKITPDFIYKDLKGFAEKNGKFENVGHGKLNYIPNTDEHVIIVIDHVGLISATDKKAAIDKVSQYMVWFRNKCNYTPVLISQTNRDSTSTGRRQTGFTDLQLSDIKDSGGTSEDANVVLSISSPYREKQENYRGYDISTLKDRFRAVSILKNRDSDSEKTIGLNFFGEIGYFKELPKAKEITDYSNFLSL